MRHSLTGLVAAAAVGGLMALGSATPSAAQIASPGSALLTQQGQSLATPVQWRRGGWRGRGNYGRRYSYRRGGGRGAAVGAGIAGLAAGAIIGGAIASQAAPTYGYGSAPVYAGNDAVEYCLSRFKSYDPGSGTYLGYDGLRHPCP